MRDFLIGATERERPARHPLPMDADDLSYLSDCVPPAVLEQIFLGLSRAFLYA